MWDSETEEAIESVNPGRAGQTVKINIPFNCENGWIIRRKKQLYIFLLQYKILKDNFKAYEFKGVNNVKKTNKKTVNLKVVLTILIVILLVMVSFFGIYIKINETYSIFFFFFFLFM